MVWSMGAPCGKDGLKYVREFMMATVLVSLGCCNKGPRAELLKQWKSDLSKFLRLKVWNLKGVGRDILLPNSPGRDPSLTLETSGSPGLPWLMAASPLSLSPHHFPSSSLFKFHSSCKAISHSGFDSTLVWHHLSQLHSVTLYPNSEVLVVIFFFFFGGGAGWVVVGNTTHNSCWVFYSFLGGEREGSCSDFGFSGCEWEVNYKAWEWSGDD